MNFEPIKEYKRMPDGKYKLTKVWGVKRMPKDKKKVKRK